MCYKWKKFLEEKEVAQELKSTKSTAKQEAEEEAKDHSEEEAKDHSEAKKLSNEQLKHQNIMLKTILAQSLSDTTDLMSQEEQSLSKPRYLTKSSRTLIHDYREVSTSQLDDQSDYLKQREQLEKEQEYLIAKIALNEADLSRFIQQQQQQQQDHSLSQQRSYFRTHILTKKFNQ